MIGFVLASLAMAAAALALLTRPWWQPTTHAPTMNDPLASLREQIRQLDALRDGGSLGTEAHASARAALERQLVDLVLAPPAAGAASASASVSGGPLPAARPRLRWRRSGVATLAVLAAALVVGGYLWLGDPAALGSRPVAGGELARSPADAAAHELGSDQIAAMAGRLAARLELNPDDGDGWAMLARTYAVGGQHDKAVPAFRKAAALRKDDAVLLADFADALAVTRQRSLAGEPLQLVNRALQIEPNNLKALSLAGTEAFNRKDYPAAVAFWEKLQQVAPPDSVFVSQVQGGIAEARALAGMPPAAPGATAASNAPATPATPAAPATTAATTPGASPAAAAAATGPVAAPAAGGTVGVSGTVSLASALAAKASPDDTVFVFARPADGARMPLAILRRQVRDLPLRFAFDDSQSMSGTDRLSSHAQLVVGARVSRNGQATPQAGDLQGLSPVVALGASGVKVEIGQTVGP